MCFAVPPAGSGAMSVARTGFVHAWPRAANRGVRLHKTYYRDIEGPDEEIALYILSGGQLRRVLRPTAVATRLQAEDAECPSRWTDSDTKLIVEQGKSQGMANIVLRTKTTFELAGKEITAQACQAPAPTVEVRTLRFDGREYQEPKTP